MTKKKLESKLTGEVFHLFIFLCRLNLNVVAFVLHFHKKKTKTSLKLIDELVKSIIISLKVKSNVKVCVHFDNDQCHSIIARVYRVLLKDFKMDLFQEHELIFAICLLKNFSHKFLFAFIYFLKQLILIRPKSPNKCNPLTM